VTRETLQLLIDLARTARLEQHRDAMFSGVHINTSENMRYCIPRCAIRAVSS
jgi:glucose-6-phosphate isomerase